jgi:hypothetical protein
MKYIIVELRKVISIITILSIMVSIVGKGYSVKETIKEIM